MITIVEINKVIINEGDQSVFFKISDGINSYNFSADIPLSADLEAYLNANKEIFLLLIRRKEYPDAPLDLSTVDDWDTWICENPEIEPCEVGTHNYSGTLTNRRLEEINVAVNAYICSHYDMGTQASFTALYILDSTPQGTKDALLSVWTWIQSVLGYYYTKKIEILSAPDPYAVTWNFTQFDATDPGIALGAIL